jgi:hypothetical protein
MELEWTAIHDRRAREVWSHHLQRIGKELISESDNVAGHALGAMENGAPELFVEVQTAEEIRVATSANIAQFGELVAKGEDPAGIHLPEPTIRVAQAAVQRDLGMAPLLRVYSLGHEQVWQWLFQRASQHLGQDPDYPQAAALLSSWLFAYVNESTRRLTDIYEEERRLWLTSALAEQAEAVAAILSGEERDEARAARRLRYDLRRSHVGLCAWLEVEPQRDAQSVLRQAVRSLAASMGIESMLVLPDGPLAVRGWLSSRRHLDDAMMRQLLSWHGEPGIRLTIGGPGDGFQGFRSSQIDASHARRVSLAQGACDMAAVYYNDVAVAALTTVDKPQAERFVERVLGPLASKDEGMMRIAETLAAFLDEHGSRSRTAERLHVHANTVSYRVKQAESILNRSLTHRTLDLRVALAMHSAVCKR